MISYFCYVSFFLYVSLFRISVSMEAVRVDKWLWAARFFKTRSQAQKAIENGKISISGTKVSKTSRLVKTGDMLLIDAGHGRFQVMIRELSEKRGSASTAITLYDETEESKIRREKEREAKAHEPKVEKGGRPDKRTRRLLQRLKHGSSS